MVLQTCAMPLAMSPSSKFVVLCGEGGGGGGEKAVGSDNNEDDDNSKTEVGLRDWYTSTLQDVEMGV